MLGEYNSRKNVSSTSIPREPAAVNRPWKTTRAAVCLLLLAALGSYVRAEPAAFRIRLDPSVAEQPLSGRLFVFLSQRPSGREPRYGANWFGPEPFFGIDVANLAPGESCLVDDRADGFPDRLSKLERGTYRVQALLDHDFYSPHPGRGAGNVYSEVKSIYLDPADSGTIELLLDRVVETTPARESQRTKEIALRSELLSRFHDREVIEPACVLLPENYDAEPERRYPVVYLVPSFGGSHHTSIAEHLIGRPDPEAGEVEFIRVCLSGRCKWGHHVYANSATNGPRGDALVQEMIPHIDRQFRTLAAPTARFLAGHSSGGWSVLWLQVAYPDVFDATFSSGPDPVDFRDFQQVDLYADPPLSLLRDEHDQRRPIARRGNKPLLWYDDFARMDDVLGRGGQLRSFEAVFSPLGPDGLPQKLFDRRTGRINPEVAKAWRKYDIRLKLEENWPTLGPKLAGKLHITAGDLDTFYLDGAVRRLAETLRSLDSDAEIEIVPGGTHSNIITPDRARDRRRKISEIFTAHHGQ